MVRVAVSNIVQQVPAGAGSPATADPRGGLAWSDEPVQQFPTWAEKTATMGDSECWKVLDGVGQGCPT